jgi:hypothetical protein
MLPAKKIIAAVVIMLISVAALAQPPKTPARGTPVQKFKPPKLTSSLGTRSDSVIVSVDEASNLISLPIKVTDDKKNNYTVSTFQCLYRRKGVTEDEVTGKVTPTSSIVAKQFTGSTLSTIWVTTIQQQLQPGEEILFFDIVAKDAQGRLMFAPNIKLKTQ